MMLNLRAAMRLLEPVAATSPSFKFTIIRTRNNVKEKNRTTQSRFLCYNIAIFKIVTIRFYEGI